ncbi:exodeoxyribonuclease III, partial [bacterium]|nr:exodeoxyribonuclease III [bacterium]
MTRIASWNVNGIRACAKKGFVDWVESEDFDAILLQEVRADESQIPKEVQLLSEYHKAWFPATSKKGYSGVAILSKEEPLKVHRGMGSEEFDVEGRVISAEFEEMILVSAYFPNSQDKGKRIDYKLAFCDQMVKWLTKLRKTGKVVVLAGDFNIAHE